jgi:NAD(P) transhydrogenase
MDHYDLVVIGSGPAGEKGAEQAARFGRRAALVERAEYLGGAGINTGTVPSKTLRETALYFSGLRQRGLYGIDYSLRSGLSVREFMHREHMVVGSERRLVSRSVQRHAIVRIHGAASFKDPHTIRVVAPEGHHELTGDVILVATGSSPFHPPNIPFDREFIHDSDSLLDMKRIPRTMAVLGGGVIGVECASIFAALGVRVTLIEANDRIVPFVDSEIVERLVRRLDEIGVRFALSMHVADIRLEKRQVVVAHGDSNTWTFDMALVAAGRKSNVEGLGLEQIGVELGERGLVQVNEYFQTTVANVYAAGDVIGFHALVATSMEQARVAITHAFGEGYEERLSPILPLAVYAIPEISMVGLTEEDCQARKLPYLVGRGSYEDNARGQIIGDMSGMIKLVFSSVDRKLLGAHIIGEQASELIHIASHVMMGGGTLDEFAHAVYNYPTLADLYKCAAYDGLDRLARVGLSGASA